MEEHIRHILKAIGEDPDREGLLKTPHRVAEALAFLTRGYEMDPAKVINDALFTEEYEEMIVQKDIDFFSLCPHHLLVYGGKIHFGYIPDGQIVGVSKIPRLVHALAARPIVQEELVSSIADAFMSVVKPSGCIVKAIGKHDCVAVRGVHCPAVSMTTVTKRGIFEKERLHAEEFDRAITEGQRCVR